MISGAVVGVEILLIGTGNLFVENKRQCVSPRVSRQRDVDDRTTETRERNTRDRDLGGLFVQRVLCTRDTTHTDKTVNTNKSVNAILVRKARHDDDDDDDDEL